jgi:hypothetical protein
VSEGRRGLFVSDIDGTLVTPDKLLTPAALEAVAELRAAGVPFTVVSSRPPRGMARIVAALGVTLPFAAFNGGSLVDPASMEVIAAHRLAADASADALAVMAKHGVAPWAFADDAWLVADPAGPEMQRERHTIGFDATVVADFDDVAGRIDKLVAPCADAGLLDAVEAELRAALAGRANVERSQAYYVDVTHPEANKGAAVRALAARLGAELADTVVIGDMTNDMPMLRIAGFGVAMGQAPDAVKALAKAVTAANTDDGFAKAVRAFVLPRFAPAGVG